MAKHIRRKLTPEERSRVDRDRAALEQEAAQIIERGRRHFERLERLHDALRALKAEREAQGLSLAEMESRCGISRSALSRLENDPCANPTIQTLDRLAKALGVELTIGLNRPGQAA